MSMLDLLANQINSKIQYGSVTRTSDGAITMTITEDDVRKMIISGIVSRNQRLPVPPQALESLITVKIEKGRIEIKMRVV